MSENEEKPNVIRTYADSLADWIVEKGGTKHLIHEFDGINMWECNIGIDVTKDPTYIKMALDSAMKVQQNIFLRVRPEIHTVSVDGKFAYAERESGTSCIMLSRKQEGITDSIDEGSTLLIKTWAELQSMLQDAKNEQVNEVAIVLGEGGDGKEYLETYPLDAVLLVSNTMLANN